MACLNFPIYEPQSYDQTEKANEMTVATDLATLSAKVDGHIKLFTIVVGFGFVWLGVVSWALWGIHGQLGNVEHAQANTPAQIVASLLNAPASTPIETQANLAAAASVLQNTKVGKVKPDSAKLKVISDRLIESQNQYPDLPQVWATTAVFINYKSDALLANASQVLETASGHPCTKKLQREGWILENCEISLEQVASQISGTKINGGEIAPFIFRHCVVEYHGGALPDGPITFENSVFRFSVDIVPSRRGSQTMSLLAQSENQNLIRVPSV